MPRSRSTDAPPELVLALGGDGTLLRAAEEARTLGAPVLGVNVGRVGFLTEADADHLDDALDAVIARRYRISARMTVDVDVEHDGETIARGWALNEISVEKASRERILDVVVEVDGRGVSAFGCDGVLCATPTGSTAYAFSAGGPIIWPGVEALLVVPSNAHALFSRPLVVSAASTVTVHIDPAGHEAAMACDGRRIVEVPPGSRVRDASRPGAGSTGPARRRAVHRPTGPQVLAARARLARPAALNGTNGTEAALERHRAVQRHWAAPSRPSGY